MVRIQEFNNFSEDFCGEECREGEVGQGGVKRSGGYSVEKQKKNKGASFGFEIKINKYKKLKKKKTMGISTVHSRVIWV